MECECSLYNILHDALGGYTYAREFEGTTLLVIDLFREPYGIDEFIAYLDSDSKSFCTKTLKIKKLASQSHQIIICSYKPIGKISGFACSNGRIVRKQVIITTKHR